MTSADMVTDFKLRTNLYETPMGTFECSEQARTACLKNDLDPRAVTKHTVEMATVQSLLKALNAHCGALAEEYNFALDFDLAPETGYRAKPAVPASVIPQDFRWLIAFAVEGGSEGYYVHVGAMRPGRIYEEFGLAKTNSSASAYELATQASRFLAAAAWN